MSLEILKAEIQTDPAELGYAGKTDQQVLDLLKLKNRSRTKTLTAIELLQWSGANQRFIKIRNASNAVAETDAKNQSAVMHVLLQSPGLSFDLKQTGLKNLIDALVSSGVLAASDRTALNNLAAEAINRFEELGIPETHLGGIAAARA